MRARELLEALRGRIPLFMASGTPEDELREIVERRAIARYFRAVRGSPSTKATILCEVACMLGVSCAELLMVGDSMTDYEAAVDTGAQFVGRVAPDGTNHFPDGTQVVSALSELRIADGHPAFDRGAD